MRGTLALVGVVLLGIAAGLGIEEVVITSNQLPMSGVFRGAATTSDVPQLAALRVIARREVLTDADASAHDGLIVLTTRRHAAGGDLVSTDQPVYELIINGHFTCDGCSRPPGTNPPSGGVLILTLDRSNLDLTDFGLANGNPAVPHAATMYLFTF